KRGTREEFRAGARAKNPPRGEKPHQARRPNPRPDAGRPRAGGGGGSRPRRDQDAQAQGTGQDAGQGREEAVQTAGEEGPQGEIGRQGQEEVMISSQSWIT